MYGEPLTEEVRKLMLQYEAQFGEMLPLMQYDGTERELVKLLKHCMKTGQPYEVEDDPDIYY